MTEKSWELCDFIYIVGLFLKRQKRPTTEATSSERPVTEVAKYSSKTCFTAVFVDKTKLCDIKEAI